MAHQIPIVPVALETIKETLQTKGACIVSGIETEEAYIEIAQSIGEVYHHRASTTNGITKVTYNPKCESISGFGGFSQDSLEFHTDRSTSPIHPLLWRYSRTRWHLKVDTASW